MTWHIGNMNIDGKMHFVPNSKAWHQIDAIYSKFATKPKNVRLGLTTNGVNSYGEKNNNWLTRPILIQNYNLPPWLVTKRFFILLYLIIPGPKNVKNIKINVYVAPLLRNYKIYGLGCKALMHCNQHGRGISK
jgi:hypothetical protein